MPKLAINTGALLVLVGIVGSLVAMTMVEEWWYAAIPAVIGILIASCGWIALKNGRARMIAIPLALLFAGIGTVGSFMPSGLNFSDPGSVAFVSSIFRLLTISISCGFAILTVRALVHQ